MSRLPLRIRQPHTQCLLICLLTLTAAACSSPMKYSIDQSAIHDNPHPRQKYEVIVTSDAPGPWDSVYGSATYTVANVDCVPKLPLEGAREVPNTSRDFKLTSPDDGKTWIGYFYRDAIEDADYFGLGVCHWDVESAGADLRVHGDSFGQGLSLQEILSAKTYTIYSKKAEFFNKGLGGGASGWPMDDEEARKEVAKKPDAFFPTSVTIRKVAP